MGVPVRSIDHSEVAAGAGAGRVGRRGALLCATGLTKRYRGAVALAALDLRVAPGESLVLLGPNGAGKSTLLSLCAGVLRADAGDVSIDGVPARRPAARAALGLVPQTLAIYPRLTARENLAFFARVLGVAREERGERVGQGLAVAGLAARADALACELSAGMQRRLHFACALLHRPRLLLLDEPTVGVDVASRALLYAAIEAERRAGVTVLWATHALDEAERFADRVLVMSKGRVCADGPPASFRAQHGVHELSTMLLQLTREEGAG